MVTGRVEMSEINNPMSSKLEERHDTNQIFIQVIYTILYHARIADYTFEVLDADAWENKRTTNFRLSTKSIHYWGKVNVLRCATQICLRWPPSSQCILRPVVRLLVWGAVAPSLCCALVAIGLALGAKQWECVAVTFVFGCMMAFGLSWIAVPWMFPAEINTHRMRIAGSGIATATNWITNYAVVLITPIGVANIAWRYYILYAALNAAFVPVVQFFYVETARKSLEDIDHLFEGQSPDLPTPNSDSGHKEDEKSIVAHVNEARGWTMTFSVLGTSVVIRMRVSRVRTWL